MLNAKRKEQPNLYIIAGPNGSGKTTFGKRFLPFYAHCLNFVNADLIASGLAPFSPDGAAVKAGKLMLEEIDNSGKEPIVISEETSGGVTVLDKQLFPRVERNSED